MADSPGNLGQWTVEGAVIHTLKVSFCFAIQQLGYRLSMPSGSN